jgi:hypothetical protein
MLINNMKSFKKAVSLIGWLVNSHFSSQLPLNYECVVVWSSFSKELFKEKLFSCGDVLIFSERIFSLLVWMTPYKLIRKRFMTSSVVYLQIEEKF